MSEILGHLWSSKSYTPILTLMKILTSHLTWDSDPPSCLVKNSAQWPWWTDLLLILSAASDLLVDLVWSPCPPQWNTTSLVTSLESLASLLTFSANDLSLTMFDLPKWSCWKPCPFYWPCLMVWIGTPNQGWMKPESLSSESLQKALFSLDILILHLLEYGICYKLLKTAHTLKEFASGRC